MTVFWPFEALFGFAWLKVSCWSTGFLPFPLMLTVRLIAVLGRDRDHEEVYRNCVEWKR